MLGGSIISIKNKTKRIIVFFFIVLFVSSVSWAYSVWIRIYDESPSADEYEYERDPNIKDEPEKNITNVLVLGIDQENGEKGRADSVIIMSFNEDTDEVALISIPRDSRVEIPGRKSDKINHSMAYGGVGLTRATVEKLLGVPIHHYVSTNFSGFRNIVDSIGGVDYYVERRITDANFNELLVKQGQQRLNGTQALAYVRFRADREGDFGRMRRQQQFLKALAEEVLSSRSIFRLPALIEQLARYVRTDMTVMQLVKFSRLTGNLNLEEVNTIQLKGSSKKIDGKSYVVLDQQFLEDTVKSFLRWD